MTERDAAPARRLIFLGTGTSSGVPMIGCDCSVCTSTDPRNQRTRPSVLLSFPGGNLLIDTTPEMRIQLLREQVRLVHAIAFTHLTPTTCSGWTTPGSFRAGSAGRCRSIASRTTEDTIRRVFSYAFRPGTEQWPPGFVPKLQFVRVAPGVAFEVLGERVLPIRLEHGQVAGAGFSRRRAGLLHRCEPDSRRELAAAARGWTCWFWTRCGTSRIRRTFRLSEALAVVEALKPRRTFLTHLSHSFDHGPTQEQLPPHVALAYDGLQLEF